MDGPRGYCVESDRERPMPDDFTYIWNLINQSINKQNGNRLIDTENILTVAKWGVG